MPRLSVKVIGAEKVKRNIGRLAERVNKATGRFLSAHAGEVVKIARIIAPVRTGALARSIEKRKVVGVSAGSRKEQITVEIGVFKRPASLYAAWVEFGTGRRGAATSRILAAGRKARWESGYRYGKETKGMKARPYLFPAFEIARVKMPYQLRKQIQGIKVD